MKRILALIVCTIGVALALPPYPLTFSYAVASAQQGEWNALLKYKLFGRDYFYIGQNVEVTEKSGYTGTMGDLTGTNTGRKILGPIVVGGTFQGVWNDTYEQGYVRVGGNLSIDGNANASSTLFKDAVCVHGSIVNQSKATFSSPPITTPTCAIGFPELETSLNIPTMLSWPTTLGTKTGNSTVGDVVVNGSLTGQCHVYPVGQVPDNVCDLYYDAIDLGNNTDLIVQQTPGVITRIFVKNLNLTNYSSILVAPMSSATAINGSDYKGTLLIYAEEASIADGAKTIMGSLITKSHLEVTGGMSLYGQLIAQSMRIQNDFKSIDFQYVPFDPPVLDPTALASGVFYESVAGNQKVNIRLDRPAVIDVTFKAWISFGSGANMAEAADLIAGTYPTAASPQSIVIPKGDSVPLANMFLQVFDDLLMENTETVYINFSDLEGAVLPGNATSGKLPLSIIDNDQLQPPVLRDTTVALPENSPLGTSVVVLTGTDLNNTDKLNYTIVSGDASGVFAIDSAANKGYITVAKPSALDFEGTPKSWTLVVRVTDNTGRSDDATVVINLTDVNETPSEPALSANTIAENSAVGTNIGTFSATDPDAGASLTYTLVSGTGSDDNASFSLVGNQLKSAAVFNYEAKNTYTIRVMVSDGAFQVEKAFTILVTDVDEKPVVSNSSYSTDEDVVKTVTAADGVLKNASDPEGKAIIASLVTGPTHGTLVLNNNGSFVYTPAANFNGTDSFVFTVADQWNTSSPATAVIVVKPVNDAPVAVDMAYETDEDVALTVAKVSGVLSLATDVDGDALTAVLVDNVAHGTLVLAADGSFLYTPAATWSGTDAFTFRVMDSTSATSTVKTATITVNYVNDAPVALAKNYQVLEDHVLSVLGGDGVLVGVTDEENHAVTARITTGTAYGALSLAPNGAFEYTPKLDFFGRDEFYYIAVDEFGAKSVPTRVVIQVFPDNDPPIFTDVSYSVPENTPAGSLIGTLTAKDPDGDPISYSLVSGEGFSIDKSGNITVANEMVLDYEATKTYSLVVAVSDGTDAVNGNVTINVTDLPERTDVVVVSATNTDSTWKYPDTVWVNKTILAVEWAVDGVLRNDTDNVASNAKTLLVKTATSPSKDLPGSDTLVVFMNDKVPEVELDLPPVRPEPIEGVTVVEPTDPKDTVIYINNSEKDIVVEIKTVDERLQPIVKYDTIHPPLTEGLNEVTYTYTDIYGNSTTTTVYVYLDLTPPVVEITSPADRFITDNVVQTVAWKVDGVYMNVLNVQTLTKGANWIIRTYRDKAGNEGSDTVMVYFDMGKDIELSLEKPLISMDEKTIEKYYATNPPAKDELYSLSILNVKTGLEEKTQYGKGGSVHKADGSEPYPGLSGSHLGPTVQIHIRLPQMGGTNAMGDQRSGLVSDLVDSTGMVLVTSGATPERVSFGDYVNEHCLAGVFTNMTLEEILASPLFESTVGLGVHIYDVSGQFVDRMSIVQKIDKAVYLDDAGMLTLFFELKPSRNHGLVDVTGRQYGTGAYILDAEVNSISKRLCDMPDGKKGELVKSSASSLEKFGYVRDSYTD